MLWKLAVLALCVPVAAQDTVQPAPSGMAYESFALAGGDAAFLNNGDVLVINSQRLRRLDRDGNFIETVVDFEDLPNVPDNLLFRVGLRVSPDESFAVTIAENRLYVLRSSGPAQVMTIPGRNADFVFASNRFIYSLRKGTTGVEVRKIDLFLQSHEVVVELPSNPGADAYGSGMALTGDGDLFVVRHETTSMDFVDGALFRIDAADLAGSLPLAPDVPQLVATSPHGFGRLVYDPARDLLYTDENDLIEFAKVLSIDPATGAIDVILESAEPNWLGFSISDLQIELGPVAGSFAPYQPSSGGALLFKVQGDPDERIRLVPKRPELEVLPTGGNAYSRTVTGGPAGGFGLIFVGAAASLQSPEAVFQLGGVPLFWSLDLPTMSLANGPFVLGADGSHTATFTGLIPPGTLAGQAVLFRPDLSLAGSSNFVVL